MGIIITVGNETFRNLVKVRVFRSFLLFVVMVSDYFERQSLKRILFSFQGKGFSVEDATAALKVLEALLPRTEHRTSRGAGELELSR